jgi:hypothetical protein
MHGPLMRARILGLGFATMGGGIQGVSVDQEQ